MSDRDIFIHPTSLVAATAIGAGTRIWAFCNVQEDSRIGIDCNICDHCFIENGVKLGDRVTVKNGVSLWDGVTIEDDVFIGPNAVFTNDVLPRSKVRKAEPDRTLVRRGASIGANAVIVAGLTVGEYAFIGAGAVVTREVPDYTIWFGNPARQQGYVCACANRIEFPASEGKGGSVSATTRCQSCGKSYRLHNELVTPA